MVSVVSVVDFEWWKTALCHELGHHYGALTTRDPDENHDNAVFAPGGAVEACEWAVYYEADLGVVAPVGGAVSRCEPASQGD